MTSAGVVSPRNDRAFHVANAVISGLAIALLTWILVLREPTGDTGALAFMPAVNASLNGLASSFLIAGWLAIRAGRRALHQRLMLAALASSALFLVGYLVYHWSHGDTRYPADAPLRAPYLAILASHVVLSIVALPMVLATFWLSLSGQIARHRRLARVTLPIWLYVSVTGVAVFLMLRSALA
jgi:putative membrane protein